VYISFFPHLVAGPIVRYAKLRPQLATVHRFDVDEFRAGLLLFSLGLAKKVLVADSIALYVDPLLSNPGELGFFTAWAAILGFSFQIYFDFSGYSDMALGLAQMFGIRLPWNFDRPYRSASPIEFWRRWHVTLSSWLRDYVYIPLGGNRRGVVRRDVNLLATMGLGGLWHGASITFVVWGLYHGLLLAATRHLDRFAPLLARPVRIAITFFLVTVGWVFFRMTTAGDTLDVFAAMAGLSGAGDVPGQLLLRVAVAALIVFSLPEEWRWPLTRFGAVRTAAVGALAGVGILSIYASDAFIYFQF
jgi:D-alanyl-lipoteichoic acid acyltransferase DltB (MBOAT superfamily)